MAILKYIYSGKKDTFPIQTTTSQLVNDCSRLKNEGLKERQSKVPSQNVFKGTAELPALANLGQIRYLSHHSEVNSMKPNKMRAYFVYATMCAYVCLNIQLTARPGLVNILYGGITKVQRLPFEYVSDIEAIFHLVKVPQSPWSCLRLFVVD